MTLPPTDPTTSDKEIDVPNANLRKCGIKGCPNLFPPNKARKYCGPECSKNAWASQLKALRKHKEPVEKKCESCGKSFTTGRPGSQKYCGPDCQAIGLLNSIERQRERRQLAKKSSS